MNRTWKLPLACILALWTVLLGARVASEILLLSRFDAHLLSEARKHAAALVATGEIPLALRSPLPAEDFREQRYWQRDWADGRVEAVSPLLQEFRFPTPPADSLGQGGWYHCKFLHRMRRVVLPLPDGGLLHLAQDYRGHKERVLEVEHALFAAGVLGTLLLLGWSWRRGLGKSLLHPSRSLLLRLATGLALLMSAVLALAGLASYRLVEQGWIGQMDQALENRARGLAALCDLREGRWSLDVGHLDTSIFRDPKAMQYFQVWDAAGKTVGRSRSLTHLHLPRQEAQPGAVVRSWFHPPYLHRTRMVTVGIVKDGERLTVAFGQDYRGMKARLRELRTILLWVWAAALVGMLLLAVLLVRVSLHPLHRIAAQLQALQPGSAERPDPGQVPREVATLVEALGQALDRQEEALRRERSLLGNLAHELRTPLAGMRTTLEVGVGDDEEHARMAMGRSIRIAVQMQGLIDSLLLLGRLEAGRHSPRCAALDVGEALDRAGLVEPALRRRHGPEPKLWAWGDAQWLDMVLGNLRDNARRHAGPEGWIDLEVSQGERIRLVLENDGCDLGPEEVGRVFERFWRKDGVRSIQACNAGLGLSLCRELVVRMGGSIDASVPRPGVFRVELSLEPAEIDRFICASSSRPVAATSTQ